MSEERTINYAGFWIRFVAFVIDFLVLNFLSTILVIPFLGLLGFSIGLGSFSEADPQEMMAAIMAVAMPFYLANAVMYWLYYAISHASTWQATLGKRAVGIVVVDGKHERLSFTTASIRYLGKIISSMTLLIGYIIAGFTAKKQALHDLVANTYVVYKN